jgi:hypothetical protein
MTGAWRKRGRPRFDRPSIDEGTPEQQVRRQALAAGGDPALTEHPLGLMLARGLISIQQHEAGCYYAMLYGWAVGRTDVSVASLYRRLLAEGWHGKEIDEEDLTRIQALYRLGKNRLLAAGRRISTATENIAVFGRPARFLSRSAGGRLMRGADFAEFEAVLEGLSVLVACYGRGAKRRGRLDAHRPPSMGRGGRREKPLAPRADGEA